MRLVVPHEHPDFDALASAALATVLYPGAVVALPGTVTGTLAELLRLYRDQVPLVDADDVPLDEVTELIVVDTAERGRLGRFAELVGRVPVTVFDHHPRPEDPLHAARGLRESVGATVTLLARRLRAEGSSLSAPLASLALLGLHEDTGDFTFDGTTADDHAAAAYFLACGGNLELVRRFRSEAVPAELAGLRDEVVAGSRTETVRGRRVAVAHFEHHEYLPSISGLCGDLLAATGADAAILVARMAGRTLVFARATPRVDVGAALAGAVGGGGHPRAAFARTDLSVDEATTRVLERLPEFVQPAVTARDVMSAPVRTARAGATLAEARQLMARHRHNGLPVVDDDGRLVGVISRRDVDHAVRHGFEGAELGGFMTSPVVTASPDDTLRELETLVLEHDVGRLPIVDGTGALVGIVTRSDLIRARHPRPPAAAPADAVLAALPGGVRDVLDAAVVAAGDDAVYVVGGTVRDGLLGVGYHDLDLVVEAGAAGTTGGAGSAATAGGAVTAAPDTSDVTVGDVTVGDTTVGDTTVGASPAARLARALHARFGGRMSLHGEFGTATLELPNGVVVDVASARGEAYARPGALPTVHAGALHEDLARRDFAINAMAVRVHPGPPALVDPFGGLTDLDRRTLRTLHPLSFVEDPTRLVRGARLAGRLGLRFDDGTLAKVPAALVPEVLHNVSAQRLRAELELTLSEERAAPALEALDDAGAFEALYGLALPRDALRRLDAGRDEAARRGHPGLATHARVQAALLLLLASSGEDAATAVAARFHLPKRLVALRGKLAAIASGATPPTDERLEELEPAGRAALAAFAPEHQEAVLAFEHAPERPRVRGRDVVGLGLAPGPQVGAVLAELEAARASGRVGTFDEELELARDLVERLASPDEPDDEGRERPARSDRRGSDDTTTWS